MSAQAYDKYGNKVNFALYKGDYVVFDFEDAKQLETQVANLTEEIERLCALVKNAHKEGHKSALKYYPAQTDWNDCWVSSKARAALQPKENK